MSFFPLCSHFWSEQNSSSFTTAFARPLSWKCKNRPTSCQFHQRTAHSIKYHSSKSTIYPGSVRPSEYASTTVFLPNSFFCRCFFSPSTQSIPLDDLTPILTAKYPDSCSLHRSHWYLRKADYFYRCHKYSPLESLKLNFCTFYPVGPF